MNSSDASLSETDRIIARYYERNRKKIIQELADEDSKRAAARTKAIEELEIRVGALQALVGEFKTLIALYKAGQAR